MKLVIGSDHGGIHLKEVLKQHLAERGIEVTDAGTYTEESCDYPDIAVKVCRDPGLRHRHRHVHGGQ